MSEENVYNEPENRQDVAIQKEESVGDSAITVEERPQRPIIEEPVFETPKNTVDTSIKIGLDVGTNLLVSGRMSNDGGAVFKMQRDAFYRIRPQSEVNKNSIKMSLDKRQANYFIDEDGSFLVVGDDALELAIERNDTAERPLYKGVISPKNKKALPILKRIIKEIVGNGNKGSKVIFSVPGLAVDADFDVTYHSEIISMYLKSLGFETADPINEAFAIGLSELLDNSLTGISCSFGAGAANVCILHEGSPISEFSFTKSGDFIDESVGRALDISPSVVQQEKESGTDLRNPRTDIEEAIGVYYNSVLKYTFENIAYELNVRKKDLPILKNGVPIVMAGGLTLADHFLDKVKEVLSTIDFPLKISDIRIAEDPLTTVANGCLMAAHL